MLTKLTVINFKKFGKDEIELGNPVVFIGPNKAKFTGPMTIQKKSVPSENFGRNVVAAGASL